MWIRGLRDLTQLEWSRKPWLKLGTASILERARRFKCVQLVSPPPTNALEILTTSNKFQQALDLIKILQASNTLPIARARMRVRITLPTKDGKRIKEKMLSLLSKVEDEEWSEEWELVSSFRKSCPVQRRMCAQLRILIGRIDRTGIFQID